MSSENLTEMASQLSPEEKAAVREFIEFVKRRKSDSSPFLAAVEFMAEHPELLQRLAQ